MNTIKNPILPDGKTCGDCKRFYACEWLFECKADSITCAWVDDARRRPDRDRDKELVGLSHLGFIDAGRSDSNANT